MGGSLLLADKIGSGHSMTVGYTIMVASFLLIYFGIRSYRDNDLAGQISFGRAFSCGNGRADRLRQISCARSLRGVRARCDWKGRRMPGDPA